MRSTSRAARRLCVRSSTPLRKSFAGVNLVEGDLFGGVATGLACAAPQRAPGMKYLAGYPASLQEQVAQLVAQDKLAALLTQRYPGGAHDIQSDRALYDYVSGLKNDFMRKAEPLAKVMFDNKLHVIRNALGTHTTVSRVQGGKLKAKAGDSRGQPVQGGAARSAAHDRRA
jgi:hypothetical protein